MNGRVIGSSICVDIFPEIQNAMYFLTQPVFTPPLPSHVDRIYTSIYNSRILRTEFQVDEKRVHSLSTDQKFLIQDKMKKLNFYVTLIDANQTPGAVMFLLEGEDIGTILYTGKFCYSEKVLSKIEKHLEKQKIDCLVTTDICKCCKEHSKSKDEALEEVVNVIRRNSNQRVVIFEPYFREDILTSLLDKLKNPISVSKKVMEHLEELGRGSDFTLNTFCSRVHITDRLTDERSAINRNDLKKILLIPCPMKAPEEIDQNIRKLRKKRYHVILYRNHCSEPQLKRLVNKLTPGRVDVLNPGSTEADSGRNDIHYWSHVQIFPDIGTRFDYIHQVRRRQAVDVTSEPWQDMDNEDSLQTPSEPPSPQLVLLESDNESDCSEKTEVNLSLGRNTNVY